MTKKRLSYKQIEAKSNLLASYRQKIKGQKRNKISKLWQQYRGKKFTIEELPKLKEKLQHVPKEKYEIVRQLYRDKREGYLSSFEYGSLKITKIKTSAERLQKFYNTQKSTDIDKVVEKIFKNDKVRYVLVILKIKLKGTDQIINVSESFTPESFEDLQGNEQYEESDEKIIERIFEKLSFVVKYDGFELISKHIRVIYATPPNPKLQEKHRKNKK